MLLQCGRQNPLLLGHFCLHCLVHQVVSSLIQPCQPHYCLQRRQTLNLAQHQFLVLTDHLEVALLLLLL